MSDANSAGPSQQIAPANSDHAHGDGDAPSTAISHGETEAGTAGTPALPVVEDAAWHAGLLASDQAAQVADAGLADTQSYDGHVALALDPGALSDIDGALDLLTSSHHLFDVPAMDIADATDDAIPT